ncbi:hypothetical protein Salat_2924600 [Sesamum alatum]|uniref:Uncharacterized protein n=1 Tax=Sesamum alatum TaxID=300844 RepID=A0AAE2C8A7_9LAMI|nr:hypothetical protein Salat_2924600 [Sesamum alatum]
MSKRESPAHWSPIAVNTASMESFRRDFDLNEFVSLAAKVLEKGDPLAMAEMATVHDFLRTSVHASVPPSSLIAAPPLVPRFQPLSRCRIMTLHLLGITEPPPRVNSPSRVSPTDQPPPLPPSNVSPPPPSTSASPPPPVAAPSPSMASTAALVAAPLTSFLEALIGSHHSMAPPSLTPHGTNSGIPASTT